MRTRLILVRHGETAWNCELVFRGQRDVPLNERGRRQSEAVADALKDEGIVAIYSSPLSRALDTAAPLAKRLGMDVVVEGDLNDANFGDWQGMAVREVEKRYPELFDLWKSEPWKLTFPNGESYRDVADRSHRALVGIAERHVGEAAAVFTHRFVLKALICRAIGFDEGFWRIFVATGSVSELWYEDGSFVLARLNDTNHLRALAAPALVDF